MSTQPRKRVVIVDGYSTARDLVPELLKRNAECLHIRSTKQLPAPVAACFNSELYDADIGYAGDAASAAMLLSSLSPDAVIAGSEWGVTFAETVALLLGLPTNRIETSAARRDKFAMIETVRQYGLLTAAQAKVGDAASARAFAFEQGSWPLVVKPLDSAGSDGVSICYSVADVERAVNCELGRGNFMGSVNQSMLVQSFLPGPQFIVNAVSQHGQHYFTDIWAQTATICGGGVVPSHIELLDPTQEPADELMRYTRMVLAALGIRNGASHTELKLTANGPALIETGARLMGAAMDAPSYRAAGADSQAMSYAKVLVPDEHERQSMFARPCYTPKRHMTKLLFNFPYEATVWNAGGLERLRQLASFHAHYRPLRKGDRVWRTADWLCCGGVVYLVHDDPAQITADIATFRRWEERGELYLLGIRATAAE
jgi:hypothetical protein